jgi:phosphopantothenoylcysteine decarboxylase / phosphopantothenate---cysteine ligase
MPDDVFRNKKIILGVTGCIAAYKACYLTRELKTRGAEVKVIMTPSALQFVAPLTFSSLSGNPVIVNIFPETQRNGTEMTTWHIDYAQWADLVLIAPSTINTVAKIVHGFADNALTTLVSAARSPVVVVPAADEDMYLNKANSQNIQKLEELGYYVVKAEEGELASGLSGLGRLADINKIIDASEIVLSGIKKDLSGKKILVTAGPTYEDIDPVRYVGNRSSGKMGYWLAKAAFLRGADVTLISGPSNESAYPEIKIHKVRSAKEMKEAVIKKIKNNNILIMAAAVADYRPAQSSSKKIKKEDNVEAIKLSKTDDILSSLKKDSVSGKKIIGFALETNNAEKNALKKLKEKNLDLIVLNSLQDKKSGFEFDTNKIVTISKTGKKKSYPLQSKFQAANNILTEILKLSEA